MAREPFVWGQGGTQLTPRQLEERRKVALALMAKGADFSPAGHWTEALGRAFNGWWGGKQAGQFNRQEEEATAAARAKMEGRYSASPVASALAGGAGGATAAPTGNSFMDSLVKSESGGNWNALNSEGYGGRLQFGEARLADAARAGIIPAGMTGAEFSRLSPEQQMAVEQWHFADIDRQAAAMGLDQFIGQTVAGIPITQDAIRGMAHLGGIGGAAKFLQTGGAYNPSDSNGTSLADYAARHGGAPSVATGPTSNEIYSLMADPWVMDQYGSVLGSELAGVQQRENAIFNQQLAMQDPMYQLGLEQKQLELEAMKRGSPDEYAQRASAASMYGLQEGTPEFQNFVLTGDFGAPGAGAIPAEFQALDMRAQAAGLTPGTPEYQEFMRNGGRISNSMPAAVAALHQQAILAGLEEGSPEYQEFMRTRGAGEVAAAQTAGKAGAEMELAAPAEVAAAEDALLYIDELRNHPGRIGGTGASSVFYNWIPGTDEYDFAVRANQLSSGAFLTAIQEMQGFGALSNQEGQTARAAIARMDTAQTEDEFLRALDDYQRILERARDRAARRIKVSEPAATGSGASGGELTDDDLLRMYGE